MLVDSGEDVDQRWQKLYVHTLVYLSRNTFPLKAATSVREGAGVTGTASVVAGRAGRPCGGDR
jgi:hypothetical protein